MMLMLERVWNLIAWYLRPLFKWLLRKTTRLCEMQRICYGQPAGALRSIGVEESMKQSRTKTIIDLMSYLDQKANERRFLGPSRAQVIDYSVFAILKVKDIKPEIHSQFVRSISVCLDQIWGYRQLSAELEHLRRTPYDAAQPEHEAKLRQLWSLLCPETELTERISPQWKDIGFQGDDPKTDFRGMGVLGLDNLLFFSKHYTSVARHVLTHSHHPTYGYSFAIVGINLTHLALQLVRSGQARSHFYNACAGHATVTAFHRFYCYLFFKFDAFWLAAKPRDIMEFGSIRDQFAAQMRRTLADHSAKLDVRLAVKSL
ncbi:ELMO domain-containing protein 2-like [Amphibalanus amphitrite]|nr:ELMO domain-containing protein 2-like [Amphibalanus amphitrite]XP_043191743.1 ELMO domain-containing protein 2-like [Amphibalanus amphitrite]XP_043191744.1 ELMO domain-containing protein 2-like [Amphibalanus amphitrite]XP_043191745.1 ELMO domain-containing protein 2-like [Amphibalanus amphitrite]